MKSIADGMAGMAVGGKRGGIAERASGGAGKLPPEPTSERGSEDGPAQHLAALHAQMGGKHMHVHSDGMNHTTHHVGEDGEVQGPHDHQDIEALKDHLEQFLSEEEGEPEELGSHKKGIFGE